MSGIHGVLESEVRMKTKVAYCSACDRDVQIAFPTEPAVPDGQANVFDTEVVCLEIGHQCTGSMCPIGATAPAVMAVRLVRSGLKPAMQPLIDASCDACDEVTKFAVISADYATCTVCGRTSERKRLTLPTSN